MQVITMKFNQLGDTGGRDHRMYFDISFRNTFVLLIWY
jgi:hypothetical protein